MVQETNTKKKQLFNSTYCSKHKHHRIIVPCHFDWRIVVWAILSAVRAWNLRKYYVTESIDVSYLCIFIPSRCCWFWFNWTLIASCHFYYYFQGFKISYDHNWNHIIHLFIIYYDINKCEKTIMQTWSIFIKTLLLLLLFHSTHCVMCNV